eukprot:TRINITY_DN14564_c0_g1_i1.p1 TRINITY_DN14564_c0_g1~~TRINITY_DN14564_c0_g1_i1.p1  ORF type:complete len:739 (+),score=139.79 TRINITY_DN14564_c0_g1_i1:164-2380(+)
MSKPLGDPLVLFSETQRRNANLPYIAKFQLEIEHVPLEGVPSSVSPQYSPLSKELSDLALSENEKVNFYLELLGRAELEEELARLEEKERQRAKEQERTATYNRLLSARKHQSQPPLPKQTSVQYAPEAVTQRPAHRSHSASSSNSSSSYAEQNSNALEQEKLSKTSDPFDNTFKVYRSLAGELERRIELFRHDPTQKEALESLIKKYRQKRMPDSEAKNLIEINRKKVANHLPPQQTALLHQKFRAKEEQFQKVLEEKKKIDEENLAHKMRIVNKRQIAEQERKKAEKLEQERQKRQVSQRKWLFFVAIGSRMGYWLTSIKEQREKREKYMVENAAAISIQGLWRTFKRIREAKVWRRRMVVVQRTLRKWIVRYRVRRKKRAADMIANFLADLQDVQHIVQIVKKFRFRVTQTQLYWRKYREVQSAQLQLLSMQWDTMEQEMQSAVRSKIEEERKKEDIMKNALNYTSNRKRRGGGTALTGSRSTGTASERRMFSRGKDAKKKKETIRVSDFIKNKLLAENLQSRRKAYNLKVEKWKADVSQYEKDVKSKAAIEEARKNLEKHDEAIKMPLSTRSHSRSRPTTAHQDKEKKDAKTSSRPSSRQSAKNMSISRSSSAVNASLESSASGTHSGTSSLRSSMQGIPLLAQPIKPEHPGHFVVLLPKTEMMQLIERGRKEQATHTETGTSSIPKVSNFAELDESDGEEDDDEDMDVSDLETTLVTAKSRNSLSRGSNPSFG